MIKQAISKFFSDLKPMTWPQRLDHIWTYYKGLILTVAFLLFMFITLAVNRANQPDNILCGVSINTTVSAEGISCLEEGYLAHLGTEAQGRDASVYTIVFSTDAEEMVTEYEYTYNQIMRPVLMVSAQELDYMLLDQDALERYMLYELYADLRTVLSADTLAALGDQVIRVIPQDENGNPTTTEPIPMAIDISALPFTQKHFREQGPVYLAFAANAPNIQQLQDFFDYLCALDP